MRWLILEFSLPFLARSPLSASSHRSSAPLRCAPDPLGEPSLRADKEQEGLSRSEERPPLLRQ